MTAMSWINLRRVLLSLFCFVSLCFSAFSFEENETFSLENLKVAPGEMKSGYLTVPGKDNSATFIPVTVINGSKKGKNLALVAGVHGYEYPPILALYRLKRTLDPEFLAGTIIFVHIANIPGFQKRVIYYNPFDWKNLNRAFPGDPEGSLSQRTAHILTEKIVKRCDYLVDLHCGDGNEALIPYAYWMLGENEVLNEMTKKMALAFGIKHIIIDKGRTRDIAYSKYLGNTTVLHEKPAITTESGYLGRTDEESIVCNMNGILSIMRLFHMIEGEPNFVSDPVWIDQYEVIYSNADGLFYPLTKMGYFVRKGEKVGYVSDFLGNAIQEYRAPFTGIILYIINTPPANQGEPLFEIGKIKEK